jgi:cag pathogenicity island protein 24
LCGAFLCANSLAPDAFSTFAGELFPMKYRDLAIEELEEVKDEFVKFLASNSITSEDWLKLKKAEPEKAHTLISIFSDLFWEKVLDRISFAELRTPKDIRIFKFGAEALEMIHMTIKHPDFDFTNGDNIQALSTEKVDINELEPELFTGSKKYESNKKRALFEILENGARPCTEALYLSWKKLIKSKTTT